MSRRPAALPGLMTLGMVSALGLLAELALAPPAPTGPDAAADRFSAGRAAEHLRFIARAPRPVGSEHHRRTREHIVARARALGAEVEVQSRDVVHEKLGNPFPGATVHNIIARLRGREGRRTVLVVAHYDSVPTSAGAADNGAAVAAMLETLRALAAEPPAKNDVVFLFTDAEEIGLLGAQAFVERSRSEAYPVVLNFDARGSGGPALMFQASGENGAMIRALAGSGGRAFATSALDEGFRRMHVGDTDLAVFLRHGAAGLNFAFLHGLHDYHAGTDRPDQLDAGSLQHHGESMLGLVRHLRGADLSDLRDPDLVYFDLFGRVIVRYAERAALPLAGMTALGAAALLLLAIRRGRARPGRIAAAAGLGLAGVVGGAGLALLSWRAVVLVRPEVTVLPLEEPYVSEWYLAAFLLLAVAAVAAVGAVARRCCSGAELAGGLLLLLAILAVACAAVMPGASYLIEWPLVASLPGFYWLCRGRSAGDSWAGAALLGLGPACAVILFVPLIDLLFATFGVRLAALPIALAVLAGLTALPLLSGWKGDRAALVFTIAAAAVLVAAVSMSGFDHANPRPSSLIHVQDMDDGRARWLTMDPDLDDWTAAALGPSRARVAADRYFPTLPDEVWTGPAPDLRLAPPEIAVLGERTLASGSRAVSTRVRSRRGAWMLQVHVDPGVPLIAATIAGKRLDAAALSRQGYGADGTVFEYFPGPAGVEIEFELPPGQPLRLRIADLQPGLPEASRGHPGPRPADLVPSAYGWPPSDASIVSRSFTLR